MVLVDQPLVLPSAPRVLQCNPVQRVLALQFLQQRVTLAQDTTRRTLLMPLEYHIQWSVALNTLITICRPSMKIL